MMSFDMMNSKSYNIKIKVGIFIAYSRLLTNESFYVTLICHFLYKTKIGVLFKHHESINLSTISS